MNIPSKISIRKARCRDIAKIHALHTAASRPLTRLHGPGPWSEISFLRRVVRILLGGDLFVIAEDGETVGTFMLTSGKPHFYREEWFALPCPAVYLHSMAIHPDRQRRGLGRRAMGEIENMCRGKAIRLDAFQGPAGAGGFYARCGYAPVHRGPHGGAVLEFHEKAGA